MQPRSLILAGLIPALACAGTQPGSADADAGSVELVVRNQLTVTFTAYVEWTQSRPSRLGEVNAGSTATFHETLRAPEVRVVASRVGLPGGRDMPPAFAPVRAGDRLEWTFTPTGPRPFLRLPPRD